MTNDAPAQASVGITDEIIARVADAIDRAEVGYHLRLTKMVDGESTYTLTYADGEEHEFDDMDEGYAHIRQRKLRAQATNVIAALSPPPTVGAEDEAPVAWLHTLHMELGQAERRLTFSADPPFGKPGRDYSEEFTVTSEPLVRSCLATTADGGADGA